MRAYKSRPYIYINRAPTSWIIQVNRILQDQGLVPRAVT